LRADARVRVLQELKNKKEVENDLLSTLAPLMGLTNRVGHDKRGVARPKSFPV